MTTETVTILLTDLVGSTELASRAGPEQAEQLRIEHFILLRDALEAHGGREVKNLGDGIMAAFGGTRGALDAAVAMQQAFEARNRDADEPMEIRIGIATGEADVDGADYFGAPVVEAGRLCDAAGGGRIIVSDLLKALAGSRGGHTFEPLEALELEGLDEPVTAHELGWTPVERVGSPPVSLPSRLARSTTTFVGRDSERAVLTEALEAARAKQTRHIVLIGGEPGIGKTTLVSEFAAGAYDQGTLVVYGRCDEDLAIPYQPWREAIGQLVDHGVVPEASVAGLLGTKPQADDRTDAEAARYELFRSTLVALSHAASEHPVLVILDDLHWADAPTVALLRHLAVTSDPVAVLVVATFRDAEITSDHPMADALAALHREAGVDRLKLDGLSDLDVLALLETLAGHEMTDEGLALRDALLAETDGNPFFTSEIIRHLVESGTIVRSDDGRWVGMIDADDLKLPVSVREVVGRRVATLGDDTQRLLRYASVIGRDFDLDLLAEVVDKDVDEILDLLEPVEELGLISATSANQYTFSHALVARTLHEELSGSRRARIHGAIAGALEVALGEQPGERTAEIARHWAAATTTRNIDKAVDSARRAGDYALANLAPDEAVRWYGRGLELLDSATSPPDDEARSRAQLLIGLGTAQRDSGNADYLDTLLRTGEFVTRAGDDDALVRAALATNRGYATSLGQSLDPIVDLLERALAVVEGDLSPIEARLTVCLASEVMYGDYDRALHLARRAVDIARRTDDDTAIASTGVLAAGIIRGTPHYDEARAIALDATEAAERVGDLGLSFNAARTLTWAAFERGSLAEIDDLLERRRSLAAALHNPFHEWPLSTDAVTRALLVGDTTAADLESQRSLELGNAAGQPDALQMYATQHIAVRNQQGRLHELDALLTESAQADGALTALRPVLAYLRTRQGRLPEAAAIIADDIDDGFAAFEHDISWSTGMLALADVTVALGLGEPAAVLHEMLEPHAEHRPCTTLSSLEPLHVPVGRLASLLGHDDDAETHFARAEEIAGALGSRYSLARTHVVWAELVERRGDRERAQDLAERAHGVATEHGYGYVQADAGALLERLSG